MEAEIVQCGSTHVWVFLLLTPPGLATGEVFSSHSFLSLELLELCG